MIFFDVRFAASKLGISHIPRRERLAGPNCNVIKSRHQIRGGKTASYFAQRQFSGYGASVNNGLRNVCQRLASVCKPDKPEALPSEFEARDKTQDGFSK